MMRSRFTGVRRVALRAILAAAFAILVVPVCMAGQPSGMAPVDAVDVSSQTVVLQGDLYRLTSSTLFVDAEGRPAHLAELRPMPTDVLLVSEDDFDAVKWQAVQSTTGWVLTELRILTELPD